MSSDFRSLYRGKRFRNARGSAPRDLGRWASYDALSESAGRHRLALAQVLGLSRSLIDRWCSPWGDDSDSGTRNPLDRIVTWVAYLREQGVPEDRATLPIRWLLNRLGYAEALPAGGVIFPGSASETVGLLVAEIGDVAHETLKALDDGSVTALERQRLGREIREARAVLNDLEKKLETGAA